MKPTRSLDLHQSRRLPELGMAAETTADAGVGTEAGVGGPLAPGLGATPELKSRPTVLPLGPGGSSASPIHKLHTTLQISILSVKVRVSYDS